MNRHLRISAAIAALAGATFAAQAQIEAPQPGASMDTVTITGDRDAARPADRGPIVPNVGAMSRAEVRQQLDDAIQFGLLDEGEIGATDEVLENRENYNRWIEAEYDRQQQAMTMPAPTAPTTMPGAAQMPMPSGEPMQGAAPMGPTGTMPSHPATDNVNR